MEGITIEEFFDYLQEEEQKQRESPDYNLYKDFDLEKHVQTFHNYCEVLIDKDGKIMYGIPSHQEKAIALACEKLGVSREELNTLFMSDETVSYADWVEWLMKKSETIFVWYDNVMIGKSITPKQLGALKRLRMAGAVNFPIPNANVLERHNMLKKGEQ